MSFIRSGSTASSRARGSGRWRAAALLAVLALIGTFVASPSGATGATAAASPRPLPTGISHEGRWLTDADGKVVYFHGVNLVAKGPGVTPADMGFDDDDAAFLAANGFDSVRLGTTAASLMPTPGVIDTAYLDSFVHTVDVLTAHGLSVLVDLHQDGWGPTLGSDGFPEWMTLTHGATNTGTPFPLYYVTNPAIQAAFDSFWANEAGPGGVGLQDQVAAMFAALASRLDGHAGVMGYDLLNEPWPGTTWSPCLSDPAGCPTQDAALDSYYQKMTTAIHAVDPAAMTFGEPYVLFNFGQAPTTVKGPNSGGPAGLSYHVYATDPANEPKVVDYADQWTAATAGALAITEFGATNDTAAITRQVDLFDNALTPWMWWAYNEGVIKNLSAPPTEANLGVPVVNTLVRPHPRLVAGTPTALDYDNTTRVLRFSYGTAGPNGNQFPADSITELQVAQRSYPAGYQVKVTNGKVTSAAGASLLTVASNGPCAVSVTVWAAGEAEPAGFDVPDCPNPAATCLGRPVTVDIASGDSPTDGDDVILGTAGNDVINAGAGNDFVCGEGGDDRISGGSGADVIFTGSGNDRVSGGPDGDLIASGNGNDRIRGDDGDDWLVAGDGSDYVQGGAGADLINGGAGGDVILGESGNDVIDGSDGNDVILGGNDDDFLKGGPGSDLMLGGAGTDRCDGGPGFNVSLQCESG